MRHGGALRGGGGGCIRKYECSRDGREDVWRKSLVVVKCYGTDARATFGKKANRKNRTTKRRKEEDGGGARPQQQQGRIGSEENGRNEKYVDGQRVRGACYGCGAALQVDSDAAAGFVEPEAFVTRARRKQTGIMLCSRCRELCNGKMVPGVEGLGAASSRAPQQQQQRRQQQQQVVQETAYGVRTDASIKVQQEQECEGEKERELLTPEELRDQLIHLRRRKVLVLKLIDVLDINGSFLTRVRDLVGSNPIILIATKSDLLPKGTDMQRVLDWLQSIADRKRLRIAGLHIVSCTKGEGIQRVAAQIVRTRKGRDVYVLGAANVGKSSFIRALLSEMGDMQSAAFSTGAIAASRRSPTISPMPGTTLGTIPLRVFEGNKGVLYDTAGLHLHHRLNNMLTPEDLKALHPKKRLSPYLSVLSEDAAGLGTRARTNASAPAAFVENGEHVDSIEWGGRTRLQGTRPKRYKWGALLHIDVLSGPPGTQLTFYGPPPLRVVVDNLDADDLEEPDSTTHLADDTPSLLGASAVAQRGGLWLARELSLPTTITDTDKTVADIAVSGLPGWVAVSISPDGFGRHYSSKQEFQDVTQQDIRLRLWAPKGIEVYVRPPLPTPLVVLDRERRRSTPSSRRRRGADESDLGMGDYLVFDDAGDFLGSDNENIDNQLFQELLQFGDYEDDER